MYDEWAGRFAAQENAKTLSVLPDPGNTMGGEDEMVVDEGSVVGMGQTGAGKRVLRKGQVRKTPVVEVSIAKAATPVSVRTIASGKRDFAIFGFIYKQCHNVHYLDIIEYRCHIDALFDT